LCAHTRPNVQAQRNGQQNAMHGTTDDTTTRAVSTMLRVTSSLDDHAGTGDHAHAIRHRRFMPAGDSRAHTEQRETAHKQEADDKAHSESRRQIALRRCRHAQTRISHAGPRQTYIFSIITCPNAEQDTWVAPSIKRAKS
jgi:hypothetical protein